MKAYKCDRCGKYYIIEDAIDHAGPSHVTINKISNSIYSYSGSFMEMDLCKDCSKELYRFLHHYENFDT